MQFDLNMWDTHAVISDLRNAIALNVMFAVNCIAIIEIDLHCNLCKYN